MLTVQKLLQLESGWVDEIRNQNIVGDRLLLNLEKVVNVKLSKHCLVSVCIFSILSEAHNVFEVPLSVRKHPFFFISLGDEIWLSSMCTFEIVFDALQVL